MGHTGTLDPNATGLLMILFNKATKSQIKFMKMNKEYTGIIRLGQTTASYDSETPVQDETDASHVTMDAVQGAIQKLTGQILQVPPMYSAVKVKGERLYKKARRGEVVDRKPNRVEIFRFEILRLNANDLAFEVCCSSGTYIRSLAHDLGQLLGVGAHLRTLRRVAIGQYRLNNAWNPQELAKAMSPGAINGHAD